MVDGVNKEFEFSRSWAVLNDIITSNVTDPLTGSDSRTSTGDWIFDGVPNPINIGKCHGGWRFPIIVIFFPNVSEDPDTRTVDDSKILDTVSFDIEARGKTRTEANLLAEKIRYQITQNVSELNKATLFRFTLSGTTNDTDFIGKNKFYIKRLSYDFMRFD